MSSTAARIEERVWRFFRDEVNVDVPSADTDLFASGALDSLALVSLLVVVEEELGWRISLEQLDLADFQSIAAIARTLTADHEPRRVEAPLPASFDAGRELES